MRITHFDELPACVQKWFMSLPDSKEYVKYIERLSWEIPFIDAIRVAACLASGHKDQSECNSICYQVPNYADHDKWPALYILPPEVEIALMPYVFGADDEDK